MLRQTRRPSPETVRSPRNENCRKPIVSFIWPTVGSTVHLRPEVGVDVGGEASEMVCGQTIAQPDAGRLV